MMQLTNADWLAATGSSVVRGSSFRRPTRAYKLAVEATKALRAKEAKARRKLNLLEVVVKTAKTKPPPTKPKTRRRSRTVTLFPSEYAIASAAERRASDRVIQDFRKTR
jgi:hypothetical protein